MFRRTLFGLFLLVAAAIPALAQFNGCVAGFCSSSSQWVFPGATLDLDFANNRYFGVANGINSLTTTRASTGYAEALNGTWVNFGNNIARRTDRGLLVEESRTNIIRNSDGVGAVPGAPGTFPTFWAPFTSNVELVFSLVGQGTENGLPYTDVRVQGTVTASRNFLMYFDSGIAAADGQTVTQSLFMRRVAGSQTNITAFNFLINTFTSGDVFVNQVTSPGLTVTSSSQRLTYSPTFSGATIAKQTPYIAFTTATSGAVDITLRMSAPQNEIGAFATSPIRTTSAAATRAADVVTLATGSWFNASVGTNFFQGAPLAVTGAQTMLQFTAGSTATEIRTRASSGGIATLPNIGGVSQNGISGGSIAANTSRKYAYAFAVGDSAAASVGSVVGTASLLAVPAVTILRVGSQTSDTAFFNGYIQRVAYFNSRLSNATLQSITQ